MRWANKILLRWRSLFRRGHIERELDDELRFHLELQIEENITAGMSPEEARYAARRTLGRLAQMKEECRDMRRVNFIETLLQDIRYGWRMLHKSPGVTTVAIVSLALGIGANTAIFTIIDAVMLKMLPIKNPSELVQLSRYSQGQHGNFSYPCYEQLRNQNHVLAGVFAVSYPSGLKMRVAEETERVLYQYVTGNYYSVLGVNAIAGRVILPEDDKLTGPAPEPVAVLSYGFWKERFAADPSVIGRTVYMEGVPFIIVGVTPREFFGVMPGRVPAISIPIATERRLDSRSALACSDCGWLRVMARLKPGVSREQARADLSVIFQGLLTREAVEIGDLHQRRIQLEQKLEVDSGGGGLDNLRRQFSEPLHILAAVVGLVLLIACANIANLLLARGAARQREIAVRLALGARRLRLIRQLLTESVLLASIGGALGLVLAYWGSNSLVVFMSNGEARIVPELTPDARVLAFTAAVSLLTGIFFGLAPGLRATRVDPGPALKQTRASSPSNKLGKLLVISQAALSLVLLIGASLLARSLRNLETMDAGFDRKNVLILSPDVESAGYKGARLADFYRHLLARIEQLPGVRSASGSLIAPVDGASITLTARVEGYTPLPDEDKEVYVNRVMPKYFETLGTPLLAGRDLNQQDGEGAPKVAIINDTMARYYFRGGNPIGRHLVLGAQDGPPMEIVGVVGDAKYVSLREKIPRTIYVPCPQSEIPWALSIFVRTSGSPRAMIRPVRDIARAADKNVPVTDVGTLAQAVDRSLLGERLITILSSFFSLLALLLACIGLYGVMSYAVVRRTNELGIRLALGAGRRDVLWLVLRETMMMVAIGIGLGLPAALAATRLIRNQLFGLEPTDPLTILVATGIMVLVAGFAGYLPARRASGVDPMVALRYE